MTLHPPAIYLALVTLVSMRAYFAAKDPTRNTWLRDIGIAVLAVLVAALIPNDSNGMALMLAIGFLVGTVAIASLLISRFGQGWTSFAGKFLVLCCLSLLALFITAMPLLLMAWWKT